MPRKSEVDMDAPNFYVHVLFTYCCFSMLYSSISVVAFVDPKVSFCWGFNHNQDAMQHEKRIEMIRGARERLQNMGW